MACRTAHVDNFFVVRWEAFTPDACTKVMNEISAQHERLGKRVLYLAIMRPEVARTDEAGRKAQRELTLSIETHCQLVTVAVEARSFMGAALRSMLSGLMLISGKASHIKFVDSVDAALALLSPLGLPAADKVQEAISAVGGAAAA